MSKVLNDFFQIKERLEYKKTEAKMSMAVKTSEAMKKRNIKNKELSLLMKKQPSVITRYLSGSHNFTIDTLVEIESILHVKLI